MARSVSSGNYLEYVSPGNLGATVTAFIRFKPNWDSGDSTEHYLWSYGDTSNTWHLQRYLDNQVYGGWYLGANLRIVASDAGLFSSGVWGNWILDYDDSANLQNLYLNNALVGSTSVAFSEYTGLGRFRIGLGVDDIRPGDGTVAEFGRWNRVLTADERGILQATGCPLNVPRGLVRYYPLIGRYSPETDLIGGENLTLTGTPAAADHPRVFLPYGPSDYFAGAAALTHYTLTAAAGTFTLTGQNAALKAARLLTASQGSYTLTGQDAGLYYGRVIGAAQGSYALTGQDAVLRATRVLAATYGTYTLTGQAVDLQYSGNVPVAGIGLTVSDAAVLNLTLADSSVLNLTVDDDLATGS